MEMTQLPSGGRSAASGGRETKRTANFSDFFCWCSGAERHLLEAHPTERTKYAGLGGVLLATFALAVCSSGYAFYSVFHHLGWTLFFALIWGAIIFNFDRFLVSTMRKVHVPLRQQVLMAVPRLLLSLLIGLTIARPLELKIFEKEIGVKMEEQWHQKVLANDSLLLGETTKNNLSAVAERNRLLQRKSLLENSLAQLQSEYIREADGTGGSGRKGIRQITQLKMSAYQRALDQSASERQLLEQRISAKDSTLASAEQERLEKSRQFAQKARGAQGFLEQNKALSDLSDKEPSVWWTMTALSLLIILIEIGPVLSKLIMPAGPYDMALAREEGVQMAASELELFSEKERLAEKQNRFAEMQQEVFNESIEKLKHVQKAGMEKELRQWEAAGNTDPAQTTLEGIMQKIKRKYQMKRQPWL